MTAVLLAGFVPPRRCLVAAASGTSPLPQQFSLYLACVLCNIHSILLFLHTHTTTPDSNHTSYKTGHLWFLFLHTSCHFFTPLHAPACYAFACLPACLSPALPLSLPTYPFSVLHHLYLLHPPPPYLPPSFSSLTILIQSFSSHSHLLFCVLCILSIIIACMF